MLPSPSAGPPRRGEIWVVNFDPTIGSEIRKSRPGVVISADGIGRLPIKLVAPLTDWRNEFAKNIWHVRIGPDEANHLHKPSAVDVLQVRGMDLLRFGKKLGTVGDDKMEEVMFALAAIVGYEGDAEM